MAAWSPDEKAEVAESRPTHRVEIVDTLELEDDSLSCDECSLCPDCAQRLQQTPATPSEAFPIEVWTFFSDSDLDQLVVDACAEMGRRELGRGRKLKPCRFCDSTRAAKFEDSDICSDKDACMKRIHHA